MLKQFNDMINGKDLGALDVEGPLAEAIDDVRGALKALGATGIPAILSDLFTNVDDAFNTLNEQYDENGYVIDAPAEHAARMSVIAHLDELAEAAGHIGETV